MSGYLSPNGKFEATENGEPLVGAKLYTYQAGTTTLVPTYTNSALSVANANPVVMDSQGRATIFLNSTLSYDFVLKRSDDSEVWTVSGIAAMATGADLNAEAASRAAADTAEANARIAADAAEASTRASADTALQNSINGINARAKGVLTSNLTLTYSAVSSNVGVISSFASLDGSSTSGVYNSANGRFTALATGAWFFTFNMRAVVGSGGGEVTWWVGKNGTMIPYTTGTFNIVGKNNFSASTLVFMTAGDYVELWGDVSVGGTTGNLIGMNGATYHYLGA